MLQNDRHLVGIGFDQGLVEVAIGIGCLEADIEMMAARQALGTCRARNSFANDPAQGLLRQLAVPHQILGHKSLPELKARVSITAPASIRNAVHAAPARRAAKVDQELRSARDARV